VKGSVNSQNYHDAPLDKAKILMWIVGA